MKIKYLKIKLKKKTQKMSRQKIQHYNYSSDVIMS